LILPNSPFKLFWNIVIILLLIYTATWMPYQICFIDKPSQGALLFFEYIIDSLFFLDIVFNFFTAIENPDGTLETRVRYIALSYIKVWFIIDSFAIVPSQIFELGNKAQKAIDSA
jgi:Ion transport protein